MQTISMTSGSGQANVDSYVSACKCDDLDSFTCNTTPLTPNSIMYVCIQSMDSDVELAFLNKLELFQGNTLGNETLLIVDGMAVQNNEISSFSAKNATAVGVASVIPSRFFSYSGVSTATVSGIIQVKLVGPGGRRLVAFDYGVSPASKSDGTARVMRGENVDRPGYGDNDVSPFSIAIGLTQAAEISQVTSAYHNSGIVKALSHVAAVAIIISFSLW